MPLACYKNQNKWDPHVLVPTYCLEDPMPKSLLHLSVDHIPPDQPSPCEALSLATLREGLYCHVCTDCLTHATHA